MNFTCTLSAQISLDIYMKKQKKNSKLIDCVVFIHIDQIILKTFLEYCLFVIVQILKKSTLIMNFHKKCSYKNIKHTTVLSFKIKLFYIIRKQTIQWCINLNIWNMKFIFQASSIYSLQKKVYHFKIIYSFVTGMFFLEIESLDDFP